MFQQLQKLLTSSDSKTPLQLTDLILARLGITLLLLLFVIIVGFLVNRILIHRIQNSTDRYMARKTLSWILGIFVAVGLVFLWAPLSSEMSLLLVLFAAGIAFASQEAIGSFFAWMSIISGRIYQVGDRIMIDELRGEVIDISPLRTKVFELGGQQNWIRGRQYTGRIVTFANKLTLEKPVYNYSSHFEYIWEEFSVTITFDSDLAKAKEILHQIVLERVSEISTRGGKEAQSMVQHYPVDEIDTAPRFFVEFSPSGLILSARFLTTLEGNRRIRSDITEKLVQAFREAKIDFAYPTQTIRLENE